MRCGMYNTLPLHLAPHHIIPPHFTLHHTTSKTISDIPNRTTPSFLTISHQHLSQHTIPLCSTIFQIAPYRPRYASHHISRCTPFQIAFHITPHSMYSTLHFRSHHILATLCLAPLHLASGHLLHTIAPHFTCRSTFCIIASVHRI